MKDLFGLLLTVIGAGVWQFGYNILSPKMKDIYGAKLVAKFAFLTLRATDAEDSAPSQAVSNAETLSNSDGFAVPARRS